MGPARGRIGAGRRDGTSHAVRRRRYRTRCADSVSRFPCSSRLRLAAFALHLASLALLSIAWWEQSKMGRGAYSFLGWLGGRAPPQTRKLTSLVPCSSWRLFTCPVFARDALRLRPTPQSSATSVRAAESSARTRTTVSRRPSSVRSTLPSATATSVAWSRRSSTTLAGESLLFCRRARRGTAIARRATWRGTVTRSEQSGFRLARGLRYGANRGGERTCVAQRQNAVAGMVAVEPCLGTKHGRRSAPETDTLAPPSQWCAARPCRLPRPVPLQDAH